MKVQDKSIDKVRCRNSPKEGIFQGFPNDTASHGLQAQCKLSLQSASSPASRMDRPASARLLGHRELEQFLGWFS